MDQVPQGQLPAWVCSAFQERPSVSHSRRQVHQLTAGQHLDLLGTWDRCGIPEVVLLRLQRKLGPVCPLFWPWPCLRLCAVCRTQGWGKGQQEGRALEGWGQGRRRVAVLNPEGAGSQLNVWRMKRRALGRYDKGRGSSTQWQKGIVF